MNHENGFEGGIMSSSQGNADKSYTGPMSGAVGQFPRPATGVLATAIGKTIESRKEMNAGGEILQYVENIKRFRNDTFDIISSLNDKLRVVLAGSAMDEVNLPMRDNSNTTLGSELQNIEESIQAINVRLLDIYHRINI